MSDQGENTMEFNDEQCKFLKLLFKKSKAKLSADIKKSERESCTSIYGLLNQIVSDVCADIIKKSETPKSCMEKVLSCGSDGTEFVELINEMQEGGQIDAMMKEAEGQVCKLTTNPQLEMKKFIDEIFEILNKYTVPKKPEAVVEEAAPAEDAAE
jgi:hypothetical protein